MSMSQEYQFSEEFQLKILAVLAKEPAAYQIYGELTKPQYFKSSMHVDACRIIQDHYEREMERAKVKKTPIVGPTLQVLFEEIRKITKSGAKKALRREYEDLMLDILDADLTDGEYVKDNIKEFGKQAAMTEAILNSVDDIEKGGEYSRIEERVKDAIALGEGMEDLGSDYFATAEDRMERRSQGEVLLKMVPTGLKGVDQVLKGGAYAGELGVIIAPPNRGKSFSLANIAGGAVELGFNAVFYTLEMPEEQVNIRFDSFFTRKSEEYINGSLDKVMKAINNMKKLNYGRLIVKKFPTTSCNINTIRSHLAKLKAMDGFVPDVIIVDYGDLVQPRRAYSDKRFELESVYLDLRDLGAEYDCPVWTASQAGRGSLDKKVVTIADLAEAFNKANIADYMFALCQTVEEKEDNIMRWHIAKHRRGVASVTLDGEIDYDTARFTIHELAG